MLRPKVSKGGRTVLLVADQYALPVCFKAARHWRPGIRHDC